MAKGNPNPKLTQGFLDKQKPKYGEPLGPGRTVRFTEAVDQILWNRDDRQEYVRKAVERQLREDGLLN